MSTKELYSRIAELEDEVQRLRKALAPREDPQLTAKVRMALRATRLELSNGKVRYRAADLWQLLFGTDPNVRETAALGHSLRALGWDRTVFHGWPMFTIDPEELKKL